jgi:hypothetical protein
MAQARAEWVRNCALARVSTSEGVDTGMPSANGMGNLVDYYEPSNDIFGGNSFTGSTFGNGINETYSSTLGLNGPIGQYYEGNGFSKWLPYRSRPLPLYPVFGNGPDIESNIQIFPVSGLGSCTLYADRLGITPVSTFYVNGFCQVEIMELYNYYPVTNLAGDTGHLRFYSLWVPSGASSVTFEITGGAGDADLYVLYGVSPSVSSYNCRPYSGTSNEVCTFNYPSSGEWHVMIRAFSNYSGVTLQARYVMPPPPDPDPCTPIYPQDVTAPGAEAREQLTPLRLPLPCPIE